MNKTTTYLKEVKAVTKEWSKENLSPWQMEEEGKKKKKKIKL